MVPVDITDTMLATVERQLSGLAGGGGSGLHQPTALAYEVRGSNAMTIENCWGVCILGGLWLPTMSVLQGIYVGSPHWPR